MPTATKAPEINLPPQSRIGDLREFVHALADLAVNVTKIGAAVSVPCGALLLISYLRSENAPMPALGGSFAALLAIITVAFVFMTMVLTGFVLMPAYSMLMIGRVRFQGKRSSCVILRDGFLYFGLYFTIAVGCVIYVASYPLGNKVSTIFGFVAGAFVLAGWCLLRRKVDSSRYPWTDLVITTSLSLAWLRIWLVIFLHERTWTVFIITLLLLFGLPLIAPLFYRWRDLLAVYATLVSILLFVWPGASFFGGATLRVLGIGGSIPVSVFVRAIEPGVSQPTTIERSGCLVLEMGGDILIKPTVDIHDCKLNRKFGLGNEWESTYTGVERYSRSDIVKMLAFPSKEDTVDGLPVLENASGQ